MHTDRTLKILDQTTIHIGSKLRAFSNQTCAAFDTKELKREVEARKRRQLKRTPARSTKKSASDQATQKESGPRQRKFNLQTYKYHALGDYANMIRQFGTSDSFSTEPVSDINPLPPFGAYLNQCRANLNIELLKLGTSARTRK